MEGMETVSYLRFFLALIFVIGLIGLTAVLWRRFGMPNRLHSRPSVKQRLEVTDSLYIDPRRRLVLVRRDEKEHLLLLGANGETVVETGIEAEMPPKEKEEQAS